MRRALFFLAGVALAGNLVLAGWALRDALPRDERAGPIPVAELQEKGITTLNVRYDGCILGFVMADGTTAPSHGSCAKEAR